MNKDKLARHLAEYMESKCGGKQTTRDVLRAAQIHVDDGETMEGNGNLEERVRQLEQSMEAGVGGHYVSADYRHGRTSRLLGNASGHGGDIPFEPMSIGSGADTGDVFTSGALPQATGRLEDSKIVALYADVSSELDGDVGRILITVRNNRQIITSLQAVPLLRIQIDLNGRVQEKPADPNDRLTEVSRAEDIEVEARIIGDDGQALSATSDGTIQPYLVAADSIE